MVSQTITLGRRAFLASVPGIGMGVGGCLGMDENDGNTDGANDEVARNDGRVTVPPHFHGVRLAATGRAGNYAVGLMYSVPDFYWRVEGTTTTRVAVSNEDSMQIHVFIWETETGTVLPTANTSLRIERGGNVAAEGPLDPILSQRLGVHYIRNVRLDTYGEYNATIAIHGIDARLTAGFNSRLGDESNVTLPLPFDRGKMDTIGTQYLQQGGDPGAISPMETADVALGVYPKFGDLPGEVVATGSSGDATVAVLAVPAGASPTSDGPSLVVAATTPYNRYVLPSMDVVSRIVRNGTVIVDGPVQPAIDPRFRYHYGIPIDGVEAGDSIRLSFPRPPQIARSKGYETAFLHMDGIEFTVGS